MAERGGQEGNQNAREGKRWKEALRRALARAGGDIDKGLDLCASKLVAAAMDGAPWALEHIAERLDGKATQVIHATHEHTVELGDGPSLEGRLAATVRARSEPTVQ